jgi:hypothetical protein
MLWGQPTKVLNDHTNLMRDALSLTSDQVYQWRILLEDYGPKIVYIKVIHNTIADATSQLEYDPSVCVCVNLTSSGGGLPSDAVPTARQIHPPQRLQRHTPSDSAHQFPPGENVN